MDDAARKAQEFFGPKAEAYRASRSHRNAAELARMLDLVGTGERALDVATGGGHTATALARSFRRVVATDIVRAMLEGLPRGPERVLAPADALPFGEGAFDCVASRIAPHHFADLEAFVRESARVLRRGGRFYVFDLTTPEDPRLAERIDEIERLRDPSHVRSHPPSAWRQALAAAGLRAVRLDVTSSVFPLEPWIERAAMPPERATQARRRLREIPAGGLEGYGPTGDGDMRVLRVELLATKE